MRMTYHHTITNSIFIIFPLFCVFSDENDVSGNMDTTRVSIITDSSELASAIPSLLDGIGILISNITILNDFDASNQVRYFINFVNFTK